MSMMLIDKNSGKEILLQQGKATCTVSAKPQKNYYLFDKQTGHTPKDIEVQRKGDDLVVESRHADMQLEVQGFWDETTLQGQECFLTLDVETDSGELGKTTITQTGEEMLCLSAGNVGSIASEEKVTGLVALMNSISKIDWDSTENLDELTTDMDFVVA